MLKCEKCNDYLCRCCCDNNSIQGEFFNQKISDMSIEYLTSDKFKKDLLIHIKLVKASCSWRLDVSDYKMKVLCLLSKHSKYPKVIMEKIDNIYKWKSIFENHMFKCPESKKWIIQIENDVYDSYDTEKEAKENLSRIRENHNKIVENFQIF